MGFGVGRGAGLRCLALLVGLMGCHLGGERASAPAPVDRVVILVIDGPRQTEFWGDPNRTHITRLNLELRPQGALLLGFRNNGPTYTTSGHAALTTGFYEDLENGVGSQLPSHAGIFQRYLKSTGLPAEKAWVIATKDKLKILADTTDPAWTGRFLPRTWCGVNGTGPGYGEDADTVAQVKLVLTTHHPNLVLINLKQPDAAGHTGVWADYLKGIASSDGFAGELWNALQADPYYAGRTAFFVAHDHGRHADGVADGFVSHGDGCVGCRAVALLAVGPPFLQDLTLPSGGEEIDLPVTVGALLGFSMGDAPGRVLQEVLDPHRPFSPASP